MSADRPRLSSLVANLLLVIVAIAVFYPAVKAAWIQPVEAMRHQ